MYQSIPSLTIARATARDSLVLTARRVGFSPNCLCSGGLGFELEKFRTVLKEKCRDFTICFEETRGSLKRRCSCAVSCKFLQKQWIRPLSAIMVILIKFSGHPRVIFANARSSLKF